MPSRSVLLLAAILRVVFLPIDAARLLAGLVLQPGAFAAGDHAVGLGARFGAAQVDLARAQPARFRARELATGHAVVNTARLPSLAVIAVGFVFLGVGFWSVALALVVLAVPPILTNAYVAVDGVQTEAVEAARGMGMTGRQIVTRVELPLALPLIFAGIRTATVFVVATATIAAVAGGGGLGDIIVNQAGYGLEGVVGAAICVSVLALVADGAVGLLQRALTPPGLRAEARSFEPDVVTAVASPLEAPVSKVGGHPG